MTVAAGPAVNVRGLTKRYDGTPALDGVELTLAPGELRGLLGRNGAGKTTLLRLLFGLIRPDAGVIELNGAVAGFVEEPAFYPYLSGRGNLEVLAELDDVDDPAIDAALERVGLASRQHDRVSGYSTGMRQRLGIAAALIRRPRVLLLDEPTSGLDPGGAKRTAGLLRSLAQDGVAVLVSSHQIGELEALCDAHTILREGRVAWDGRRDEVAGASPGVGYTLYTSDDRAARALTRSQPGVHVHQDTDGLAITGSQAALDGYAIALGREGIAIRRLVPASSALERLFFARTS